MRTLVSIGTYNEAENIVPLVEAVLKAAPGVDLLVIDDSSPDGTGRLADDLAQCRSGMHVVHRPGKMGLDTAIREGFAFALARGYDLLVTIDADFSHDPMHLPALIAQAETSDVVVGSRRVHGGRAVDWTIGRRAISFAVNEYARRLLHSSILDLSGGYNAYRRSAMELLTAKPLVAKGFAAQIELKCRAERAGLKVKEIPIVFPDRKRGDSKLTVEIAFQALVGILRLAMDLKKY